MLQLRGELPADAPSLQCLKKDKDAVLGQQTGGLLTPCWYIFSPYNYYFSFISSPALNSYI